MLRSLLYYYRSNNDFCIAIRDLKEKKSVLTRLKFFFFFRIFVIFKHRNNVPRIGSPNSDKKKKERIVPYEIIRTIYPGVSRTAVAEIFSIQFRTSRLEKKKFFFFSLFEKRRGLKPPGATASRQLR